MLKFKSSLFLGIVAASFFSGCDQNVIWDYENEKPRTVHVNTIIKQVCKTRDTVSFKLKEYELTLPCGASKELAASSFRGQDIDYSHQDYVEGILPLPVSFIHLRLMDPKIYNSYWEVPPPAGALIYISISSNSSNPNARSSPYQNCERYNKNEIWCKHSTDIAGTELIAGLHFNGGSTHALSAINITPEKRPWAYYPEDSWPQLYEHTERFVKSLIK